MITFTKEKYAQLCKSYLGYIENTAPEPAEFIASEMRRYAPVGSDTVLYITLMLLNEEDRDLLGELLVRIHYAKEGHNIIVDNEGEDADVVARRLNTLIQDRADAFSNEIQRIKDEESKNITKIIQRRQQKASRLKKANKTLAGEIRQMQDQIAKKQKQIDSNETQLQECIDELRQLSYSTSGKITGEEKQEETNKQESLPADSPSTAETAPKTIIQQIKDFFQKQ